MAIKGNNELFNNLVFSSVQDGLKNTNTNYSNSENTNSMQDGLKNTNGNLKDEEIKIEQIHHYFMNLALKQAEIALKSKEVPVGCVAVKNRKIIASSFNLTNIKLYPTI